MKTLIIILLLLLPFHGLLAQNLPTRETPTQQEANKACNVPDIQAVKDLDLTEAQIIKIREIHADIERECAAVRDGSGRADAEIMARHQERIQTILTPEQYEEYAGLGKAERKVKSTREVKGEQRTAH